MKRILSGLLLVLICTTSTLCKKKEVDWDIYHTSEQINDEMERLSSNCNDRLQLTAVGTNPALKMATLNKDQKKNSKAFIVFGQHPRELISSETGLRLLQKLCQNQSSQTSDLLDEFEIAMILNANPKSRKEVEKGKLCLRENENGIDMNRNYDAHWEKIKDDQMQTTSGDHAESEPETIAVSNALQSFKPDLFLSIHSGALGLYTPHAYTEDQAEENETEMLDILSIVGLDKCSDCTIGSAGQKVGYLSSGTSLDYAYDTLGIRYSYVFQIFDQGIDLRRKHSSNGDEEDYEFVQVLEEQNTDKKGFLAKKEAKTNSQSCMLQTSSMTTDQNDGSADYDKCFRYFNPEDKEYYEFNVENWSDAIIELVQLTGEDKARKEYLKRSKEN